MITMTSGYTPCACRDCMDVTVSSDDTRPELCAECKEAGCEPWQTTDVPTGTWYGTAYECQREDAYGDDEPEEYIYRSYHRRNCATPWFHANAGHVCPVPGEA